MVKSVNYVLQEATFLKNILENQKTPNAQNLKEKVKNTLEHTHQQGYGSLVDFGHALQGYAQVADAEDGDNQDS